ncbi:zinc-ribbon domain-containing protein, partial [Staphylococcus aureus]
MFCSNCGTKVDNMSKFCPNCGNELILNNSNKNSRQQYENEFNRYPSSNIYTR